MIKVLPSIYRAEFGMVNTLDRWGWHKLSELLDVVNNLLKMQKLPEKTKERLIYDFFHLKKDLSFIWFDGKCAQYWSGGKCIKYEQIMRIREVMDFNNRALYVPAGWGIAVAEAVKRGVYNVCLLLIDSKYIIVGFDFLSNNEIKVTDLVPGKIYLPIEKTA